MDQMLQLRLIVLGGLLAIFGLGLAVAWLLSRLGDLRAQRAARLLDAVRAQLGSVGVDARARADVRWGLVPGHRVVAIDMGDCSDAEAWRAISGLAQALPAGVGIEVRAAGGRPIAWAVERHPAPAERIAA